MLPTPRNSARTGSSPVSSPWLGSLLSFHGVLAALAAVAATGMLAGILIAAPRISPLAAGLPGLLLIGWTALYLANVRHAVELIPLKSYPSGAGYEAMLFNGILGAAGLAMIIPMFVPSRWRTRNDEAGSEATVAGDYVSGLAQTTELQELAGSADTVQPVTLSPTAGTLPSRPPWSSFDRPAATRYPTELGESGQSSRRSGRTVSATFAVTARRVCTGTGS
jgi:hypothetical protein